MADPVKIAELLDSEHSLRDYLIERPNLIEDGLVPLGKEHQLPSAHGAGGRVDILARDAFDHLVVIEIKRSDKSARETLHELSKYVSLLIERDRVSREMIRCVVVSTDWHELHVPLSYFSATAGVDVRALEAKVEGGKLLLQRHELVPVSLLPQFSPEMSIYQYESEADRESHIAHIRVRCEQARFLRLALVLLDRMDAEEDEEASLRAIACMWRIRERNYSELERAMENDIGWLEPYGFPGWEAECDAQYWLLDDEAPGYLHVLAEERRGTPEKITALLDRYTVPRIERIGDWPRNEVVNSDAQILSQLRANNNLKSNERVNRHLFDVTVSPSFRPSWEKGVAGFLAFIHFEPRWQSQAKKYLASLDEQVDAVQLRAYDKNNFFYAIHQARVHPNTDLSFFEIMVKQSGVVVGGMRGYFAWDGTTCPDDAEQAVNSIFGSAGMMAFTLFSAVDTRRYETAYRLHGFNPAVDRVTIRPDGRVSTIRMVMARGSNQTIQDFVLAHREYADSVAAVFARVGNIPTSPMGGPILYQM